jgi:hypothetical protein
MELLLVKYGFVFTGTFCVSMVAHSKGVDNNFNCWQMAGYVSFDHQTSNKPRTQKPFLPIWAFLA